MQFIEPIHTPTKTKHPKIRLLILGGGAVVSEFYLPALYILGYAEQVVIVDASAVTVKSLKEKFPNINVQQGNFDDFLDEVAAKEKFDAVVIALPNWLHEKATIKALNCGLHVLCEKPLALSQSACLKLAKYAESVNRVLAVGMVRRSLPSVSALSEALDQKLIDDIVSVDIEDGGAYAWLSDSGAFFRPENGGVLADIGVHYLDLVENLIGKLIPVKYQDDSAGGVEANLEFHLETASGINVRLVLSRTHTLRNTLVFRGKKGELILEKNTFDTCFWRSHNSKLNARFQSSQPFANSDWALTFESCFAEQFLRFADTIQGGSSQYVSGQEAASTINLIEWAYQHRTPNQQISNIPQYASERPKLSPAPVVVTGGTGFIGTNLVERLHELNFERIVVPVRGYRSCSSVARFPVSLPLLDLLDYQQVKASLTGARYVFHLAYGRDGDKTDRITIEGTKNVVEAAIEVGAESVVILSTMYVFGYPDTKTKVDETWGYAPKGGEYGETKAQMEQWCLQRAASSQQTRIVILNPSCVYGPDGKTFTRMPLEMAKQGNFGWIEEGKGTANYTYVNNLVDAILLAADSQKAHGERFLINDGATTWYEFISPFLGSLKEQPSFTLEQLLALEKQIPRPSLIDVARAVVKEPKVMDTIRQTSTFLGIKQIVEKLSPDLLNKARKFKQPPSVNNYNPSGSDIQPVIPPSWLADLFGSNSTVFSAEKAQRILGWKPLVNLEQGQTITRAWLKDINLLH